MTFQDALVAYKTYSKVEGKSPKTVAWVVSSVDYFADFLGLEQQDIEAITGNDLRRFIIALQDKPKFGNHPYNKPQKEKLSPPCRPQGNNRSFSSSLLSKKHRCRSFYKALGVGLSLFPR